MKKRRTSIAAFLLLASLSLGVGYAALTDTLTVTGGAKGNVDESNLEVVFTEVKEATLCSAVISNDPIKATMTVDALDTKGQKGVAKLVVTNNTKFAVEDELDATLSTTPAVVETDVEDYFSVTAYWEDTSDLVLEAARTGVEAGTNVLVIEVELIKTPTDSANLPTATFTVTFTATTK